MKEVLVQELRTRDGFVLKKVPASVVRQGLQEGWLLYSDEALVKSGEYATLDNTARPGLWKNKVEAAERRLRPWALYGVYFCTVLWMAISIWYDLPYLQNEWLDLGPFHRFFIVYCYLFWMLTPLLFRFRKLMGIVFPIMVGASLGPLTGVNAFDMAYRLGADAVLYGSLAALVGYIAGFIAWKRHERVHRARENPPVPESVRLAYEEGYISPAPPPMPHPEPAPAPQAQPTLLAREANRNEQITITLIHGTRFDPFRRWRRRPWTAPGSFVRQGIEAAFPRRGICFREFEWSGSNSHAARLKYSEQLRHELLRAPGSLSNHFLLAHSHGGTVASYALRDPDLQSKIGGLVTIGTPFLLTRPLSWGPMAGWWAIIVSAFGTGVLLWMGYGDFNRWFDAVCDFFSVPANDPAAWTCLFFILLFTLSGVLLLVEPCVRSAVGWLTARANSAKEKFVRLLDTADHPPVPLLCVHDAADEARRWLRALNRAATLPERIIFRFSPVLTISATVVFIVVAGYLFAWWPDINTRYQVDSQQLPAGPIRTDYFKYRMLTSTPLGVWVSNLITSTASSVVIAAGLHLVAALILLAIVLAAQKLLIGSSFSLGSVSWYDVATSWLVRIRVIARPRNLRAITGRDVSVSMYHGPLGGLKHSAMLQSPAVLREVVTWLGDRIGVPPSQAHLGTEQTLPEAALQRARLGRFRARYVIGWLAAVAGLAVTIIAAAQLTKGQFERGTQSEFVLGGVMATIGSAFLASPWLSRFAGRRRRACQRIAALSTLALPLLAGSWYARLLVRTPLRVAVVMPEGLDGDSNRLAGKLRQALDPLRMGVRILSLHSRGLVSCQAASEAGANRNAPAVIWLAPEPTLFHTIRIRPRPYGEFGLLREVPDIEDRCVAFPADQQETLVSMTTALAMLDLGASRQAAAQLSALGSRAQQSSYANFYAGLAEALQHRPKAALAHWSSVPASPELLSNLAVLKTAIGEYGVAFRLLNEAIRAQPRSADLFVNRGNLRRITGDFRAAQDDFTQAAKLEPDTALRAYLRGLNLHDGGNEDGAAKEFAKSTDLDPTYIPPYIELHDYFNHRHAFLDYRPYTTIRAALRQPVGDIDSLYYQAHAYEIAQKPQDAIQLYDTILRAAPHFCEALVARVLVAPPGKKQKEEQIKELQVERLTRISNDDPDCIEADDEIATLLNDLHRPKESIEWYGKLIAKKSRIPESYNARGAIYWQNACREEAIAEFRHALEYPATHQTRESTKDGLREALTHEPFDPAVFARQLLAGIQIPETAKPANGCRIEEPQPR